MSSSRWMQATWRVLLSPAQPELIEQWHREKGMLAFSLRGAEAQATVLDVLVKPVVPYADLR